MRETALIILLVCFGKSMHAQNRLSIDTSIANRLIEKANLKVEQTTIDSLAEILFTYQNKYVENVQKEIVHLIALDSTKFLVCRSLSKYNIPSIDESLAQINFPSEDSLGTANFNLYLSAIENSGGNACFDKLVSLATSRFANLTVEKVKVKSRIWETLYKLNHLNSLNAVLGYYTYNVMAFDVYKNAEFELFDSTTNPIYSIISKLPNKRQGLLQVYTSLYTFLLGGIAGNTIFHVSTPVETQEASVLNSNSQRRFIVEYLIQLIAGYDSPPFRSIVNNLADFPLYTQLKNQYGGKFVGCQKFNAVEFGLGEIHSYGFDVMKRNVNSNDDYKKIVAKLLTDICTTYNLKDSFPYDSLSTMIDKFSPPGPQRIIFNGVPSNIYFSINLIDTLLRYSLISILSKEMPLTTARYLAKGIENKEWDVISLALYSLSEIQKSNKIKISINLTNYNTALASLSISKLLNAKCHTTFVDQIASDYVISIPAEKYEKQWAKYIKNVKKDSLKSKVDSLLSFADYIDGIENAELQNKIDQNLPFSDSTISSFTLLSRNISLIEGLYEEKIQLNYASKQLKPSVITWIGSIPANLLQTALRFPQVFDFLNYSFAISEFRMLNWGKTSDETALNLVREQPLFSIPYLLAALKVDSSDKQIFYDCINLNDSYAFNFDKPSMANSQLLTMIANSTGIAPPPLLRRTGIAYRSWFRFINPKDTAYISAGYPPFFDGFNGNKICTTDSEYNALKQWLETPTNLLGTSYTLASAFSTIKNWVSSNQPDYIGEVPVLGWLAPSIFGNRNDQKFNNLNICDRNIQMGNNGLQVMTDWDMTNYDYNSLSQIFVRQTVIDKDFNNFVSTFELRSKSGSSKFISLESRLPPLSGDVKKFILTNARYEYFDLTGATINSNQMFSSLYNAGMNEDYGINSTQNLLLHSGYLWMPSVFAPFMPSSLPINLLEHSAQGTLLIREINWLASLTKMGKFGFPDYNYLPDPNFVDSLKSYCSGFSSQINQNSSALANKVIADLKSKDNSSFGFQLSWSSDDSYSYSVDYSNSNLNFQLGFLNSGGNINLYLKSSKIPLISFPISTDEGNEDGFLNDVNLNNMTLNEFNSTSEPSLEISNGLPLMERLSDNVPQDANFNATTVNYWKKDPDGTIEYMGTVPLDQSDFPQSLTDQSISGPFSITKAPDVRQNLAKFGYSPEDIVEMFSMAKYVISGDKINRFLSEIKNGTITQTDIDDLVDARNKGYEKFKIEIGDWFKTDFVDNIVPKNQFPPSDAAKDITSYLNGVNQSSADNMTKLKAEKKAALGPASIFTKKVKIEITYDKALAYMITHYFFECTDGTFIPMDYTSSIPFFLIKALKRDPTGHIYEKLMANVANSASANGIEYDSKAEKSGVLNTLKATLDQFLTDPLIKEYGLDQNRIARLKQITVKDTLTSLLNEFKGLDSAWGKGLIYNASDGFPPSFFLLSPGYPAWHYYPNLIPPQGESLEIEGKILLFENESDFANRLRFGRMDY